MAFRFGEFSNRDLKLYSYLSSWQLVPGGNTNTLSIPGRDGVLDFGTGLGPREIKLTCGFMPQKSAIKMGERIDQVASFLSSEKGLQKLVLSEFPDRFFMARISGTVDFKRQLRTMGSFELTFFCPDPYGYALADDVLEIKNPGAYVLDRQQGNTGSYPLIRVDADFLESTRPRLELNINDEIITLSGIWPEGSVLELDCLSQTARFIGQKEALGNAMTALESPVFPALHTG